MPRFISKEGVWEPATERVVDPNAPRGQEIYEGPDREAVKMIGESGGTMGQHYSRDAEMIMRARQLGYKTVDEYLKDFAYDKQKALAAYEAAKAVIHTHQNPAPKPPVVTQGGGELAPGAQGTPRRGGFELPPDAEGLKSATAK